MKESFTSSLETAEKVTIFWCPVVKASNYLGENDYWKTHVCDPELALDEKVACLTLPSLDRRGSLVEAALQLCSQQFVERIEWQLQEILHQAGHYGWYKQWSSIARQDGKLTGLGYDIYELDRVAMARRCLAFDTAPELKKWESYLRASPTSLFSCSLGLYEEDCLDDTELCWVPEINVAGTYEGDELRKVAMETRLELTEYLRRYCREMLQKSVYIRLFQPGGAYDAWLYAYKPCVASGEMLVLGETHEWRLKTPQSDNWLRQFTWFWRNLVDASTSSDGRGKIRDEMQEMGKLSKWCSVGATLEPEGQGRPEARLFVSGRARFFFEAAFPSHLKAGSDFDYAGDADLILLHTEAERESCTVLYAVYAEDPGIQARCLCGWHYPGCVNHECMHHSYPTAVVKHRSPGIPWILSALETHRGNGWNWRLLSSPHFFFANSPNALRHGVPQKQRLAAEHQAKQAAFEEWERLFSTVLCIGTQ